MDRTPEEYDPWRHDLPYSIVDMHAHFFPHAWFRAVWGFFEKYNWRINYMGEVDELVKQLKDFGVSHFTILNYLHKPGLRDGLAEFTRDLAAAHPGALPVGTLYPGEPGNLEAARKWFNDWGFIGLKMQPLVTEVRIDHPDMLPVFELMAECGKHLIIHAGTAPYPNHYTRLDALEKVLEAVPGLPMILAHMGGYDFEHALAMMERFPNMCLDTTMIFVNSGVFDSGYPLPLERLEPFRERILFGSDFPNIPYNYRESLDGLRRFGFDEDFLRMILHDNAVRIFKLGEQE